MAQDQTPPMSMPRVAAGAIFFDDDHRVLLVKPTYKKGWDIPGGYVEPGETPIQACEREIEEELGLQKKIARLLVIDWAPSDREGDKVLFVFDGGQLGPSDVTEISVQRQEIETFRFFEQASFPDLMPERLSKRIEAACRARVHGVTSYLQHGSPVTLS